MSKGKKTPAKLAYQRLSDLMNRPGNADHPMLEMSNSIFGRNKFTPQDFPELDDREMVLVFTAHLEEALELALTTHFTIAAEEVRTMFSYPNGPLAEFNAKIAMGRALGIYDNRMRDDLRWIKNIRNAFAHVRFKVDFSTPEIQGAVDQLHFPGEMTQSTITVPSGGSAPILPGEPVMLTPRQRFTVCVTTLTQLLRFQQSDPTKPRRLLGTPFYPYGTTA